MSIEATSADAPIFRFSASFRVCDAPNWHGTIESETGLVPSATRLKGELVHPNTRFKRKWGRDVWILRSPLSKELPLSEHLKWLWREISPHISFFRDLVDKGVHVDIFCGYRSDSDTAGFSVEPEALRIIHELQIPLEVSVIIHSMDEG